MIVLGLSNQLQKATQIITSFYKNFFSTKARLGYFLICKVMRKKFWCIFKSASLIGKSEQTF